MRFLYIIGLFCFVTSCVTTEPFSGRFSPEQIEYAAMSNAPRLKPDEQGLTKIQMGDIVGENVFSMTEILDSMLFIPLETNDESILGGVDLVRISRERIYVSDDQDELLIFDLNGKFINKLSKGQGPGEIRRPYAFDFDEKTQRLIVLQTWGFIFYDKNGKYIEEEIHPFIALDFVSTNEGYIFFHYMKANHHLDPNCSSAMFITDKSFIVRAKGINVVPEGLQGTTKVRTFFLNKVGGSFMVSQLYNDTIYEVNDKYFRAKYVIDFDNKIKVTKNSKMTDTYNSTVFYYMGSMLETEGKYQLFRFMSDRIGQCVVYRNMKTGKMVGGTSATFLKTEIPQYCFRDRTTYKDYFVSVLYPQSDMKFTSSKIPEDSKRRIENLDEEDNPVLVLYKVKF